MQLRGPTCLETGLLSQCTGSPAHAGSRTTTFKTQFPAELEPISCESLIRALNATHSTRTARDLLLLHPMVSWHTTSFPCMDGIEHNSMLEIAGSQPHLRFIFTTPLPPTGLATPVVTELAGGHLHAGQIKA